MMEKILFEAEHVKKYFGPVKAVDDVSLKIMKGETFGLVGESGCGKTTLGRTVLNLLTPTDGKIYITTSLDETPPTKIDILNTRRLRELRKKMQIVYQDPASSLNPRMIIKDIIGEPLSFHKIAKDQELIDTVTDLLEKVGLQAEHLWRYPYEMSGGQRQRVAIARAIALNPEFIVLDEPTSALDVSVQAKILNLLKDLQKELQLTYLFITHDMSVIDYMCNRVGVMYLGKLVEIATKDRLFKEPLHPYTTALLSAIPSMDPTERKVSQSIILPGEVGSPSNPPTGCHFHPRCKYAFTECGWGARDLQNYFMDNANYDLNFYTKSEYVLVIKSHKTEEIEKVNELIITKKEKEDQEKEPLFETIKSFSKKSKEIEVKYDEKDEPELLQRVKRNRYVACLLYEPLNETNEGS
ncbi:ABC transporter ATP-binding protein [Thermoproteota archaeon]